MNILVKLLNFFILINIFVYPNVSHSIYEFDDKGFMYVNESDEFENQMAELKLIIRSRVIFINRMIQEKINIHDKLDRINKEIASCNTNIDDIIKLKNQEKNLKKIELKLASEIKEETNRLNILCKQLETIYFLLESTLKNIKNK